MSRRALYFAVLFALTVLGAHEYSFGQSASELHESDHRRFLSRPEHLPGGEGLLPRKFYVLLFSGINVFHSRDLVHWKLIGYVLNRPEQFNLDGQGVSRGLFAPAIRYHNGLFYVTCTLVDIGGNFVATAKDPAGPWSNPVWLPQINGIDPSLFFDDDGKAYIVYNSNPAGRQTSLQWTQDNKDS